MLAKAVKEHDSTPQQKAPTLAQQLFSSSPLGIDNGSGTTFRQPFSQTRALKPSAPSTLNWKPSGFKPPLKRTASQAGIAGNSIKMQKSWSSTISTDTQQSVFSRNNGFDLTRASSGDGGVVDKLHDNVDWDENDFIDDADVNLDVEEPTEGHSFSSKVDNALSMKPPSISATKQPLSSSQQIPWSSSPLRHKLTPPDAKLVQYPTLPSIETTNNPEREQTFIEAMQRPTKRRTIPWLDPYESIPDEPTLSQSVQDIADRQRKNHQKGRLAPTTESFTPFSKDKMDSPYPWNKTASAVKEEQKKHRQEQANQGKKRFDPQGKEEEVKKVKKAKARGEVARVFLSDEQKKVLDLVDRERKSVFFTGSAGTGKSVLLRELIKVFRERYKREPDRVAVTASTGLAACNVGGITLHSFAGIGLGKEAIPELVKKIKRNQKAKNRWMRTKILIIDEISMVDGDLFDKLEGIARAIRNNGRPFGGIQLVITGDFFQLPPVPDYGRIAKFAFDAATWNTSIEHTIGLTQVFRQKDPVFAGMLNEMRLGKLTSKSISAFYALQRPLNFRDDFEATELFPTRQEVDNANNLRMRNLGGSCFDFLSTDGGMITDKEQRDKLLANCMAPAKLTLKKGAQVMLIKNLDDSLVNGSIGKVIGFMDVRTWDYYKDNEESFQAVGAMENDENMSSARSKLKSMISNDLIGSTGKKWPMVRFSIVDGTTRDILCQDEPWKIELPNGEVQASRSQVPLILAWALSIHKAQGQTLERVKVDLGKIFEKGQAYVALSRATCQEGLQITRFNPSKVMAHEKVRTFYNSLYNIDQASKAVKPTNLGRTSAKGYEQEYFGGDEPFVFDEEGSAAQPLAV